MHKHLTLNSHELPAVNEQLQKFSRLGTLRSSHIHSCHRVVKRRGLDSRCEVELFDALAQLRILFRQTNAMLTGTDNIFLRNNFPIRFQSRNYTSEQLRQ